MIPNSQYQLLDFGQSEKLESFGGVVVRRETPSATGVRLQSEPWRKYELRGQVTPQGFRWQGKTPDPWRIDTGTFRMNLRTTPTGQLGLFPEQADNWTWIADAPINLNGLKAINLFAYTGGSSMALACRGANVVHVDSAKSVVNWARSNAADSGLKGAPIRWIVEDALTFVKREISRGNTYDIVVADPPSFGRGPGGEFWKIQRDIEPLFDSLAKLTTNRCQMLVISCHTPGIDHKLLEISARTAFDLRSGNSEGFEMSIASSAGKSLPSGSCFRWMQGSANSDSDL